MDGGRIWVSCTLTELRDEHGDLMGFAEIMRKWRDQMSLVETLECRVASCEQAQQCKNTFISTLAHELRSPLLALSNAADLLKVGASECADVGLTLGIVRRQMSPEVMPHIFDLFTQAEFARSSQGVWASICPS
jgi:signal transduction histidine kinase